MRVIFRADASREIGTGHVMRCLTLARALRSRGVAVGFVSRPLDGDLIGPLRAEGIAVDTAMPEDSRYDWLVVDHYDLDAGFEASSRRAAARILVIDDLANRKHDCDLLLDPNLHDDMDTRYRGLVPPSAVLLAGPRFALLRDEFIDARPRVRPRHAMARLLVFFGGSDPTDDTSKTIHALRASGIAAQVRIVVGASNPRRPAIEALAGNLPSCEVLGPTSRMADLMLEADLAIGAGGSTSWERCCLGLPSMVIAVAANQVPIAEALARHGYHRYLGTSDRVPTEMLSIEIGRARRDFADLASMGARGTTLVDGGGASRVLAAMGFA